MPLIPTLFTILHPTFKRQNNLHQESLAWELYNCFVSLYHITSAQLNTTDVDFVDPLCLYRLRLHATVLAGQKQVCHHHY